MTFPNHPKGWFFVAKYIYQDHHKMAEIKTTRVWDGLTVDEYTDTATGKIDVRVAGGDTVLATSSNSQWTIVDLSGFTSLYNARPGARVELEPDEFEEVFQESGVPVFNEDRANILNQDTNYESADVAQNNRTQFAQVNRIPSVIDPTTGQLVNQDGSITDGDPFGEVGDTQTLIDGAPSSTTDGFQNPNFPWSRESGQFLNDDRRTAVRKSFRYPLYTSIDDDLDYLQIEIKSYEANGLGTFEQPGSATGGASQGFVFLPMQAGLSESRIIDWQNDRMNPVQREMGNLAVGAINDVGGIFGGNFNMDGIKSAANNTAEAVKKFANRSDAKQDLTAYFAGKAAGFNILGRTSGAVINPNLELLFNGPKLRTFQYSYMMTPRDEAESEEIRKIIYKLKKHSAPKGREQDVFLKAPDLFQLTYIYGATGAQHPFMNKLKECALTNIGIDYTPDGSYMTYGNGAMTAFRLSLTFSEIKPVYNVDYDGDGSTDMGH